MKILKKSLLVATLLTISTVSFAKREVPNFSMDCKMLSEDNHYGVSLKVEDPETEIGKKLGYQKVTLTIDTGNQKDFTESESESEAVEYPYSVLGKNLFDLTRYRNTLNPFNSKLIYIGNDGFNKVYQYKEELALTKVIAQVKFKNDPLYFSMFLIRAEISVYDKEAFDLAESNDELDVFPIASFTMPPPFSFEIARPKLAISDVESIYPVSFKMFASSNKYKSGEADFPEANCDISIK